jgi:phosphatidylserine decarboxylase
MALSLAERFALALLRELPLHAWSRAAGWLAAKPLPPGLQRLANRAFAAVVGADLEEAAEPASQYPTLQDFFTRELAKGVRPIDPAPDAFVAPCDGAWGAAGRVENGTLLQMKGRTYSLGALLGADADARRYEGGAFATFYLAPRDYHRFHAPCDLQVVRAVYLPGRLWPVNRIGVEGVPGLFAENERVCMHFGLPGSGAEESLCLVAVGATLVGKVRVVFDETLTTGAGEVPVESRYGSAGRQLAKGDELGRFEFGSTLVLVATRGALALDAQPPGSQLRLGRRIGRLTLPVR